MQLENKSGMTETTDYELLTSHTSKDRLKNPAWKATAIREDLKPFLT